MLGAEGVKTLVIRRLMDVLPKSLQIRREILGCDPAELPDPVRYVPSPEVDLAVGEWPAISVAVDDTPGEISNAGPIDADDQGIVQQYQLEYNVLVGVYTWSADSSPAGALIARLQAERLALGCREALLQRPMLVDAKKDHTDQAHVNYDRWVEDYGALAPDQDAGGWIGTAQLRVPILATEFLDRSPYMDHNWYVLTDVDLYRQDPVTREYIPGTFHHVAGDSDTRPHPPTGLR